MWAPREKFWLTLYNQKRIDAAWVAFSDAGAALARRKAGNRTIPFGRQTAGGDRSGTCLLILKIGGKIVVEGSSNSKIHIFDERNPRAPRLLSTFLRLRRHSQDIRRPGQDASWPLGGMGAREEFRPDELAMFIFRSPDQPQGTRGKGGLLRRLMSNQTKDLTKLCLANSELLCAICW